MRPRLEHQRLGLIGERVTGFRPAQLADRAHVAGHHGRRGPLLLAQREGQRADAFVLVVVGMAVPGPAAVSGQLPPKNDAKWPDT